VTKETIKKAFGGAVASYEDHAPIQDQVAALVAEKLAGLRPRRGLEIGCGTGLLSARLLCPAGSTDWTITDLSPEMVEACANRWPQQAIFQVMDGEVPTCEGSFDVIASSLAFQWFHHLSRSLSQLLERLTPEGELIFATLGPDSFQEWKAVLLQAGLRHGMHDYASADWYKKTFDPVATVTVQQVRLIQSYETGLSFLQALRHIGAATPRRGYAPLSAGQLRALVRQMGAGPLMQTYDILICSLKRKTAP